MEKNNMENQVAQAKIFALGAAVVGIATLIIILCEKAPKPKADPNYLMHEMVFTEGELEKMFDRHEILEIRFDWEKKLADNKIDTFLTLKAVGGYQEGDRFIWDDAGAVSLVPRNVYYRASPLAFNINSPIYYDLDSLKAVLKIEAEGPIPPDEVKNSILMIPSTTSDMERRYCLYYKGETANAERMANPAPPFSSLSRQ
jgi:hypothetical protein